MKDAFFIVGPTATGKSELAADAAHSIQAEIVSADAFQIYRGLDLLSAKPDAETLAKAPHHLIGAVAIAEELNAEKFRQLALKAIDEIHSRNKSAIVVGGSGLYVKALTHGLAVAPSADPVLRAELEQLPLDQLRERLVDLDPESSRTIDMKNRRRVTRALEIALAGGKRSMREWKTSVAMNGVVVFRERAELNDRINRRVEKMFENGVVEEVRAAGETGPTAAKMIGLREIQAHLAGTMSILECKEKIKQATRQYAKRQLTWFRHQTNFQALNLSQLHYDEAVERISQLRKRSELAEQG